MESYALYLLRSVAWLTGFALVFILFLKNERFFLLNRIYLITGIVVALIFPFITVHYVVNIPLINSSGTTAGDVNSLNNQGNNFTYDFLTALFIIYITGAVLLFLRVLKHNNSVLKIIKNTGINKTDPVKLIRTADYKSSFSFFSYVIVNPSVSDDETREIMNHEIVHIKQMHWIDLVLVEVLCLVQWFNPLVWIYMRLIRQNHEYLADEVALQRSTDPAIYKATLLNQIVGSEVVSLTNSFSYSLSKKRFNMMKKIISSPYRKLKFFLILPVFAIVLYAFATPEYRYTVYDNSGGNTDQVSTQKGNDDQVALIPEAGRKIEMVTDIQDDTVRKSGKRAETLLPPPPPPPPPASTGVNSDTPPPPPCPRHLLLPA